VNHYVPYIRQLPTVSHLLLQGLFTKSSHGQQLLDPSSSLLQWRRVLASYSCRLCLLKVHMELISLSLPSSPMHSEHPVPSAACPFQFLIYYSVFFCGMRVSLSRGLCWFIPGVAVVIMHATYFLTCLSASPKQVGAGIWWHGSPPGFSG
jgi:hypothetical protein